MFSLLTTNKRDPHQTSELPTPAQTQQNSTLTDVATNAINTWTLDINDWVLVPSKEEETQPLPTENNLQLALVPVTREGTETTIPDNNQTAIAPIGKMERKLKFQCQIHEAQTVLKVFIATSGLFMVAGCERMLRDKQPIIGALTVCISGTALYAATNMYIVFENLIDIVTNSEDYILTDTSKNQSWNFRAIKLQLKRNTVQADWIVKIVTQSIFHEKMS